MAERQAGDWLSEYGDPNQYQRATGAGQWGGFNVPGMQPSSGDEGYATTMDMVTDPKTGESISRQEYDRRYGRNGSGIDVGEPNPNTPPTQNQNWETDGYAVPGYTAPNASQNAMVGWEQANWQDQNMQTPKYTVGRILSQFDPRDPAALQKALPEIQKAYPGAQIVGGDKLQLFNGDPPVDVWGAYEEGKGGQNWWWGSVEESNNTGGRGAPGDMMANLADQGGGAMSQGTWDGGDVDPFASMGGGVKLAGGGWVPKDHPLATQAGTQSGSVSTSSSSTTGGAPAGAGTELWQMLMERAKQGTAVGRDDQAVRSQTDAYSAQEERARRLALGEAAERNSPYSTGAQSGLERLTAAQMGQRVGGFEAELIGREITARRQEIQQALDQMGGMLTEQQRQALQLEIAKMDNSLERLRSDRQDSQYYAGLSQAERQFLAQLGQRDKEFGADNAYRYASLGQNQNQFLDTLGFNVQKEDNYWDWLQRGNRA